MGKKTLHGACQIEKALHGLRSVNVQFHSALKLSCRFSYASYLNESTPAIDPHPWILRVGLTTFVNHIPMTELKVMVIKLCVWKSKRMFIFTSGDSIPEVWFLTAGQYCTRMSRDRRPFSNCTATLLFTCTNLAVWGKCELCLVIGFSFTFFGHRWSSFNF